MTKIFIFVLEAPRNEDLEDYITEKLSCMCKCNGMGGLLKTRPSAVPIRRHDVEFLAGTKTS